MPSLIERARRYLPLRRRASPDPFVMLELQARLSRLATELDTLSREPVPRFAVHHHAEAATRAYEMTLAESCRLVGISPPGEGTRASRILVMEAELVRAGWTW